MEGRRWKVWWMVMLQERPDIMQAFEAAGFEVVPGRPASEAAAKPYTEDELVEKIPDMDAVMTAKGGLITRRVLQAARRLRVIAQVGVGVESIDVAAATDLGILVTYTPIEEHYTAIAEYAVGMILSLVKKFKLSEHNAYHRQWRSVINGCLWHKTVGIVGLGRIGSKVARMLQPFEVKLLGYDPYVSVEKGQKLGVELTDLETLLRESDFVTIHTVQTSETVGLIGEAQLRMMKPTACLVNTARGAMVDEDVLARALREGWISGAGLDVFDPEVPKPDNPLFAEELYLKTIYTAHTAGLHAEGVYRMPLVQMENCIKAMHGEFTPEYVVNPGVIPRWQERLKLLSP